MTAPILFEMEKIVALARLKIKSAILDAEIVCLDQDGRSQCLRFVSAVSRF